MADWDGRFFGAGAAPPDRDEVEARWSTTWRALRAAGEPWGHASRHMIGLRNGQPGARRWRQVWSDASPEGRVTPAARSARGGARQRARSAAAAPQRRVARAGQVASTRPAARARTPGLRRGEGSPRTTMPTSAALIGRQHGEDPGARRRHVLQPCHPEPHRHHAGGDGVDDEQQPPRAARPRRSRTSACQMPSGVTSAKPHRLISALMRFGPSARSERLPMTT